MINYGKNNFRAIISVQSFFESFGKKNNRDRIFTIRNYDLLSVDENNRAQKLEMKRKGRGYLQDV